VSRALWIASELAGAVDSWHRREEAHGGIDAEAVLLQSGQVVVVPPPQLLHGALARRQDVRAVAALALALWQRTAPIPDLGQRFTPLVDTLRAAAEPGSPSLLPMTRLSELLREAGEIASRPPRQGLLARLFGRS
jgi:hypothetical protein